MNSKFLSLSVKGDKVVIYTETDSDVDELAKKLERLGVRLEVRFSSLCG